MSLATWKAEFYPIDANKVPADRALAHSLRKWVGLMPKALEKHGLHAYGRTVVEQGWLESEGTIAIDADTCALCVHYISSTCECCPIKTTANRCRCLHGPYAEFVRFGNPVPMIRILRAAYEAEYAARKMKVSNGRR